MLLDDSEDMQGIHEYLNRKCNTIWRSKWTFSSWTYSSLHFHILIEFILQFGNSEKAFIQENLQIYALGPDLLQMGCKYA